MGPSLARVGIETLSYQIGTSGTTWVKPTEEGPPGIIWANPLPHKAKRPTALEKPTICTFISCIVLGVVFTNIAHRGISKPRRDAGNSDTETFPGLLKDVPPISTKANLR